MGSQADPLDLLRPLMDTHSPLLHALVVPSEDSHQVCMVFRYALCNDLHKVQSASNLKSLLYVSGVLASIIYHVDKCDRNSGPRCGCICMLV